MGDQPCLNPIGCHVRTRSVPFKVMSNPNWISVNEPVHFRPGRRRQRCTEFSLLPRRAIALSACGGGGKKSDLGGSCKVDNPDTCKEGLVCDVDETCRKDFGAECDAGASESECIASTQCDDSVSPSVCLLAEGEACASTAECAEALECVELAAGGNALFRGLSSSSAK